MPNGDIVLVMFTSRLTRDLIQPPRSSPIILGVLRFACDLVGDDDLDLARQLRRMILTTAANAQ